jgi:formylglycine-generating enzyme required for sulfatase activity/uncharacterized protein with von Willebrand factor type A (vWA) domain
MRTFSSENLQELGTELDLLLDHLACAGLKIGPRERIAATALTSSLITSGAIRTLDQLKPILAPLLARSPEERRIYHQQFEAYAEGPSPPDLSGEETKEARPLWPALWLGLLLAGAGFSYWWLKPPIPVPPQSPSGLTIISSPISAEPNQATAPTPTDVDTLDRIANAAEPFEGAPTIEELARQLSTAKKIDWPAESYAIRLYELSGLPRHQPLALFAGRGLIWAQLALALDRIEQPGYEKTLSELAAAADQALKGHMPGAVYKIAEQLSGWLADESPQNKAELIALIQRREYQTRTGRDEQPSSSNAADEFTIERALAIAPEVRARRVFAAAPWEPHNSTNANKAPAWVPWAAASVPLAIAVLWLATSLALRKAFLRRRPPKISPLHIDLVAEAASRLPYATEAFRRIAQRLQRRTARPTDTIDGEATIAATIVAGGEMVMPVYRMARHAPEYLALIERRSAGDQDALRLGALVARLQKLVPIVVFYFTGEPSVVAPERGGRAVPIERLQAQVSDYRLLILAAGSEFLDPTTLAPHASAVKLRHWSKRALLTPLPLAEWGREEFALAHELDMPVGRATPEGLLVAAEMLGLQGAASKELLDPSGDGLARPLPETLRIRPQRFLYSTPPSDMPIPQLLQELRNFLDGPSFEWLCALAVYPAVQWDLTLYLGIALSERVSDTRRQPIYREDRIAALTQLPWLREGHMPNWVRRALIADLRPNRAAEIRIALNRLLLSAQLEGNARDGAVKLRIAREIAKDRLDPGELFEDEVLLDFLARGRIDDLTLPKVGNWLERLMPRRWIDRFGIPELVAGLVAAAYAASAGLLAPRPSDGALLTGAWLPLLVLGLGGIFALAVANPAGAYRAARSLMVRACAPALAFTFLALAYDPFWTVNARLLSSARPVSEAALWSSLGSMLALAAFLLFAAAAWLLADRARDRLGIPLRRHHSAIVHAAVRVAEILTIAGLVELTAEYMKSVDADNWPLLPAAIGLIIFIGGWLAARALTDRLSPPRTAPRGSEALWSVASGFMRATLALMPILVALLVAQYVAASSQSIEMMPGGTSAIAETPDGQYLAVGGMDGVVRVFRREGDARQQIQRIQIYGGPVTGLAIRSEREGDDTGPIVLAAGSADGTVRLYDARQGLTLALPPIFVDVRSVGAPPRVALGPSAKLLAAVETFEGITRLVTAEGERDLTEGGPVTAVAAAGYQKFVVATLDGRLQLLASGSGFGRAPLEKVGEAARFPGRGRILKVNEKTGSVLGIGDDGTLLRGQVSDFGLTSVRADITAMGQLRLGQAIPWKASLREFRDCAICPQMVVVPAGSFTMGSPANEAGRRDDEGPQHPVTIATPFAVGRFAATFDEWDACVSDGGCGDYKPADQGWGRGRRPVINVSWQDAKAYVAWLARKTGQPYRLLTEAEWEYAVRSGAGTAFSWGDEIGDGNANCNACGSEWDGRQTSPVQSFKPVGFGLFEMAGNVWKWVEDCYEETYDGAPFDGSARSAANCPSRVLRGGSWFNGPQFLRSASRSWGPPDGRNDIVGFRVARSVLPARLSPAAQPVR